MNPINPGALQLSKWTATDPKNSESHFLVTAVVFDDENRLQDVELRATKPQSTLRLCWQALQDDTLWTPGWV
uniref:TIGR02450 family Trp-rich protein n=1 Tax=Marinobacterium profundum TaxID=1714300 RepID=UPI00082CC017|nr:TIGR02450 family Trp-rich protein [Marinobacterium profundum]